MLELITHNLAPISTYASPTSDANTMLEKRASRLRGIDVVVSIFCSSA